MIDGTDDRLEPVVGVTLSLLAVARRLRGLTFAVGGEDMEPVRISPTELAILWCLRRAPGNQRTLARWLHADPSTINPAVNRLRRVEGWIERTPRGLALTAEGDRALRHAENGLLTTVAMFVGRPLRPRELEKARNLAIWLDKAGIGVGSQLRDGVAHDDHSRPSKT